MRRRLLRPAVPLALVATVVGAASTSAVATSRPSARDKVGGSLTVLAASSLTTGFTKIGKEFERKYPDASVTFSFNSSSTLETQIEQGAPADVFASADEANMQKLVDADGVDGDPIVFARNHLQIAVEPGNPQKIKTLADTVEPGITLVLCAPEVPCGRYALQAYENAGVDVPDAPTAENAKATLSKVVLGEADAAIVYVTDVAAAKDDVDGVKIPDAQNVVAAYPIASLAEAQNAPLAKAFVRYVDEAGQRILRKLGFLKP